MGSTILYSTQPQAGSAHEPERALIIAGPLRGLTGTIVCREERRVTIALDGYAGGVLAVMEDRALQPIGFPVPPPSGNQAP
jgi:hypothetical protein